MSGGGSPLVVESASPPRDGRRESEAALERYYRLHARLYDATRWSFLFGRTSFLRRLPTDLAPRRILEVGCGTGVVLDALARRFPRSEVLGVDLSDAMLARASRRAAAHRGRVRVERRSYDAPCSDSGGFDLVVASYSLTMFNPGWEQAIDAARRDLRPGGRMCVVDFHDSPLHWFRAWMWANHVRMEGQLLPMLRSAFEVESESLSSAFGGLWRRLTFVGRRDPSGETG